MKKNMLFYIIIFVLSAMTLSAILPYPIFSSYTNITEKNALSINNYFETEIKPTHNCESKILDLDFKEIKPLLPETFEIIDIETENTFLAKVVGGNNHVDIVFDSNNKKWLLDICQEWSWERRPVLVKINDTGYFPASLACYPHGYQSHFCLHFKNSKTDGTNRIDTAHQKTIDTAKSKGDDILSS